jgi:OOP family OmpA-OmpF porin
VRIPVTLAAALTGLVLLTFYCVGQHGEAVAEELAKVTPRPPLPLPPTEPSFALYMSGGAVYLDGTFPNTATHDAFVDAARKTFPGKPLRDAAVVAPSALAREWTSQLPNALSVITKLSEPRLAVLGERAHLSGATDQADVRADVEGKVRRALGKGELVSDVAVRSRTEHAQFAIAAFLEETTIEFESGSSTLTEAGRNAIAALATLLNQEIQTIRLDIEGHTDNSGMIITNRRLSLDRAEAVKAALVTQGIPAHRMDTHGYGSDRPIADNNTDEGKKKNRRIEIHVR